MQSRHIIDVHSHIYPETYLHHLEGRTEIPRIIRNGNTRLFSIFPEEGNAGKPAGRPTSPAFWDIEEKVAFMDHNGIDRTVVSLGNPWVNPMPTAEGDALARVVNDELATYAAATGGRIIAMGTLPASSVDAIMDEMKYIAQKDGLVGCGCGPKLAGKPFDHPDLTAFWAELERSGLSLFVHPENGVAVSELGGYGHALPIGAAFPMETTVTITRMVFGGILERHPDLRVMVAHGGGTLPYLAGRLDAVWRSDPAVQANLPNPPSLYLQRLYYDGLVYYGPALQALVRLAGADHVMFGTDHPFSVADPQGNINAIAGEFQDSNDARQLLGKTAKGFFKV